MLSLSKLPLVPSRRFARALALALVVLVLSRLALGAPGLIDRATLAWSSDPDRRAHAVERLADPELLLHLIEDEPDATVRLRAIDQGVALLASDSVAAALARRLNGARADQPGLVEDLRAAAALADARSLGAVARLLQEGTGQARAAAFTALAAIVARGRLEASALPALAWADRGLVSELAESLDDDGVEWRVDALRMLAARVRASPVVLARLRARVAELDRADDGDEHLCDLEDEERMAALDFLWLRGDPIAAARRVHHERARALLLLPGPVLARRRDADELDRVLALVGWTGRGGWRWFEALAGAEPGRSALRSAMLRARDVTPWLVAAAIVLHERGDEDALRLLERVASEPGELALWARAGLGRLELDRGEGLEAFVEGDRLEELPWPVVRKALGGGVVPMLVRASGSGKGGRLTKVLEAGVGTETERELTDLAVEGLSLEVGRD